MDTMREFIPRAASNWRWSSTFREDANTPGIAMPNAVCAANKRTFVSSDTTTAFTGAVSKELIAAMAFVVNSMVSVNMALTVAVSHVDETVKRSLICWDQTWPIKPADSKDIARRILAWADDISRGVIEAECATFREQWREKRKRRTERRRDESRLDAVRKTRHARLCVVV